jgi:CHAT domain-containing protein/tetratricopeptide (TPR) repeat protein
LAPRSLAVASSLHELAVIAFARGHPIKATNLLEQALEIREGLAPEGLAVASSLHELGRISFELGDLDEAEELLWRAYNLRRDLAPESIDLASSLNWLGNLAQEDGELGKAANFLERALKIQQRLAPGSLGEANILNDMGTLAHQEKDFSRAGDLYIQSLKLKQDQAPESLTMSISLVNLGLVEMQLGDLNEAADIFYRALNIRKKLSPNSFRFAAASYLLGITLYRNKEKAPYDVSRYLNNAYDAAARNLQRLGSASDLRSNFRTKYDQEIRRTIATQIALGRPADAFHTLEGCRAVSFLAQLAERDLAFSDVPEELRWERQRIARSYDVIQHKIAQLKLGNSAQDSEEGHHDLLLRLRRDYEEVTAKITKASPRLSSLRYPQPLAVEAVQETLDPGTVMLSYSVGEESTEVFVLADQGDLQVKTLALGERALRGRIESWIELIPKAHPGDETGALHDIEYLGKLLYQELVAPVAATVARSERLLIISDGPLHLLPWGALIRTLDTAHDTGRNWQYLAEWKPLHTVLSATVYDQLKHDRRPTSKSDDQPPPLRFAGFGDPLYPRMGKDTNSLGPRPTTDRGLFDGWEALPYTRQEVEQIAALFPLETTRTYLGAEATEEVLKALGRKPRILHLAAHGHLDNRVPLDSAVVFTVPMSPTKDQENGLLQVWEILERVRLDADLVVLSACASALGEEQAGEGLIGLTRAFQYAGARSVVASLWNVQDQATAELMVRFYRHLTQGLTKDKALRAAQLEFIRGAIEVVDDAGKVRVWDYSAPYFWAQFQIYGDWQ